MRTPYFGVKPVRQQVLLLTSVLNRWCQVREDLLFAFEQAARSDLEPGLRKAIQIMLVRINGGMHVDQALQQFSTYSRHEHFQDLIIAIRTNMKGRGNLPALLESMEWQFYKLEEAYQNRKLINAKDFATSCIFTLVVPVLCAVRAAAWPSGFRDLLGGSFGFSLAAIASACYLFAWLMLIRVRRRMLL